VIPRSGGSNAHGIRDCRSWHPECRAAALNTHLTDPEKPYLALLDPALAKTISETSSAAVTAKANL
jgi:hypothetical protein